MAAIDPARIGEWFEAHAARMLLYARQWHDADAAQDVVQDVFAELIRQRCEPANVKAWLYRATRHRAISKLRSRRRRRQREARVAGEREAIFACQPGDLIDARAVADLLATLPDELREVVVLRLWGQMTLQDIAAIVGSSVATVFRRYENALNAIREALEQSCAPKKT